VNPVILEKISTMRLAGFASILVLVCVFCTQAGANAASTQHFGKNGVVYACYKAKGKNRGALRVVGRPAACRKLRGWRRMSWHSDGSARATGDTGGSGTAGAPGAPVAGQRGSAGPAGTEGSQGAPGEVEKSLIETVQTQTTQIQGLSEEVTNLTGELTSLEATVQSTCAQLTALTDQSDELVEGVAGISLSGVVGGLLEVPPLPEPLGSFECT
jgi:hypothetical protein